MAFTSGSNPTSRSTSAASAAIVEKTEKTVRQRYYEWLKEHGPATDYDAVEAVGIPLSSVNARRNELVRVGLVEATGDTVVGGPYDRELTLWRALSATLDERAAELEAA